MNLFAFRTTTCLCCFHLHWVHCASDIVTKSMFLRFKICTIHMYTVFIRSLGELRRGGRKSRAANISTRSTYRMYLILEDCWVPARTGEVSRVHLRYYTIYLLRHFCCAAKMFNLQGVNRNAFMIATAIDWRYLNHVFEYKVRHAQCKEYLVSVGNHSSVGEVYIPLKNEWIIEMRGFYPLKRRKRFHLLWAKWWWNDGFWLFFSGLQVNVRTFSNRMFIIGCQPKHRMKTKEWKLFVCCVYATIRTKHSGNYYCYYYYHHHHRNIRHQFCLHLLLYVFSNLSQWAKMLCHYFLAAKWNPTETTDNRQQTTVVFIVVAGSCWIYPKNPENVIDKKQQSFRQITIELLFCFCHVSPE